MSEIVWRPSRDYKTNSRIARFMRAHGMKTVRQLHRRSAQNPEWFWNAVNEDLGVEWFEPYHTVRDMSDGFPWTRWFAGGKLNIVHNCLDRHIRDGRSKKRALIWESENGSRLYVTYGELYDSVNRLAAAMQGAGIKKGDTVAMCMTSTIAAVEVMYAAMKIGAVPMQPAASIAPDMFSDYLSRAEAKILFAQDVYYYRDKEYALCDTIASALANVPSLKRVIVLRGPAQSCMPSDPRCIDLVDFLEGGSHYPIPDTVALDAEDRALILLSSGTTGKPKIVVHAHGGMLVNTAKELGYAFDARESDVFFWQTNLGWMMWPWEILGTHFFGGTVLLYDGHPTYPNAHRLFELIARHGVTVFGFTAPGIAGMPRELDYGSHDLSGLRMLGSTGAPLKPEPWRWFFETFGKKRCPIMNISGGTELMGCLVSPLPNMPQKPGSVGGPALGMDVVVFDETGKVAHRGQEGILVCRAPFPSMTRGFLGDAKLFLEAYFSQWPAVWTHPDRVVVDRDGFWFINGRADDLIVRGGVKFDPVVIDTALRGFPGFPAVKDAVTVGVPDAQLEHRIVCFIILDAQGDKAIPPDEVKAMLRAHVRNAYDKKCALDEIHFIHAAFLPRTKNEKTPRKRYAQAYCGEPLGDISTLTNPEVFEEIARLRKKPGT